MRLNAIILIAALSLSIFSPISLRTAISPDDQVKYFASLDVCDAPGFFAFAKGDIPSIHESLCWTPPLGFPVASVESDYPSIVPSLFSVRIERPPKI
jgi:hypothetical protein